MTALVILTVLLIVCGSASAYRQRKEEQEAYTEYMANRITFDASEVNSDK